MDVNVLCIVGLLLIYVLLFDYSSSWPKFNGVGHLVKEGDVNFDWPSAMGFP